MPQTCPPLPSPPLATYLSTTWGRPADQELGATPSLGLSGGRWTMPISGPLDAPPLPLPRLIVNLAPLDNHALSVGGRLKRSGHSAVGALRLAPANESVRSESSSRSATFAHVYIPPGALLLAGHGANAHLSDTIFRDPLFQRTDPLVHALVGALLAPPPAGCGQSYRDHLSLGLLSHLIAHFGEAAPRQRRPGGLDARRAARAIEILEASIAEDLSLRDLANAAGMSVFHFARAFKRTFGCPPHAYLRDLRLHEADRLLRTSRLNITEIAFECGYSSSSAFTAAFRRRYACTPSDWRRSVSA